MMKVIFAQSCALALMMLANAAQAQSTHPFVGKTCAARYLATSGSGTGSGKYEFQFSRTGTLRIKWTSDSGQVTGDAEVPYAGVEDKYHVFKSDRGLVIHIDAQAKSGTSRSRSFVTQFQQMACS